MDNLLSPAYPVNLILDDKQNTYVSSLDLEANVGGFTKLELASLMVMQGLMAGRKYRILREEYTEMAQSSVILAKAVLEEANK